MALANGKRLNKRSHGNKGPIQGGYDHSFWDRSEAGHRFLIYRPEVDTTQVALMGGSMGGYVGTLVAGLKNRFSAVNLTVTGAWPGAATADPFTRFGHTLNFALRISAPVLMVNATGDSREMGEKLYSAMPDPKQQIWYESGHYLPPREYNKDILNWLHKHLISSGIILVVGRVRHRTVL